MRLLNVLKAQSRWLFPVEDINPDGLDWAPLLEGIKRRYSFQGFPLTPDQQTLSKGIRFTGGSLVLKDERPIAIENISIFRDGVVVETRRTTAVTDAVIDDLLFVVLKDHGFRFEPEMLRAKRYLSQLVVTSTIELGNVSDKLRQFETFLSQVSGAGWNFKAAGMAFNTDPENPEDALQFRFERRAGSRFEERRYFTEAPFATDQHQAAITEMERILVG